MSVAPVSRIQRNEFLEEEIVLQEEKVTEVEATLAIELEVRFQLDRLLASLNRF